MPNSFQVDPEILRHLREEKSHTQCSIARELKISERGYQKIEATGKTRLERAIRLCDILEVNLEELSGDKTPQLKTEYWMKKPICGTHHILSSAQEVMCLLEPIWADFKQYFEPENEERPCVEIHFENGRYQLLSRLDAYNKEWKVEFRRIRFDESKGLMWGRESKLEERIMASLLEGFFSENADEIRTNGVTKYIDQGRYIAVVDEWKVDEKDWFNLVEVEFEQLDELKRQLIRALRRFSPDKVEEHKSILDRCGFASSSGVMLNIWPKVHGRSDCYKGVANPIRIEIARSISSDSEVQSSWAKESKRQLISDLIAAGTDDTGDVLNSRLVDWTAELDQKGHG